MKINLHNLHSSIAFALLLSCQVPAFAIGDGPRAYMLAPKDSQILTAYGMFIDGNQALDPGVSSRNIDLEVDIGVFQYTHSFSIFDNACGAFLIAPFGSTEGTFNFSNFSRTGESSGLGDIQFGSVIGLYGSPALEVADYITYDPGFSLGLLGKLTAPTGEYDEDKVINLGANRWGLQVGVPMGYYLGDSLLDPDLTTFELLPSVFFFGDNSDPFRADETSQGHFSKLRAISLGISTACAGSLWMLTTSSAVKPPPTVSPEMIAKNPSG